jgi:ATP-dependent RNA helicase SUPV3L1/SUV3
VADAIHSVKNLTVTDRIVLCNAPVSIRDKGNANLIKEMATCIADQRGGSVLDIKSLDIDVLDKDVEGSRVYLKELETLHKGLVLYLWLSFRFPGIFTTRPLAQHIKEMVEVNIEATLKLMSFDEKLRKRDRGKMRRKALLEEFARNATVRGEEDTSIGIARDAAEGFETADVQPNEAGTFLGVEKLSAGEQTKWDNEGEYPLEAELEEDGLNQSSKLEAQFAEVDVYERGPAEATPLGLEDEALDAVVGHELESPFQDTARPKRTDSSTLNR